MSHAELTDEAAQQAVDGLGRTHHAEAAHLGEVDDHGHLSDRGMAAR